MTPQQIKENEKQTTLPIHCDYSKLELAEELKPNPANPNLHDENQTRLLCAMLKHQGWREAIIVSNRSGLVVCGHGRLKAAKLLGLKEVPVDLQDFKNETDEVAHMIADNRISELSFFDNATLKDVLLGLDTGALDMEVTGYDENALEDLMTQFFVDAPEDFPDIDESLNTEHKCPKCGYKWSGKAGEE
jgi:ParB-like chromosome segregation protein Spo0J